MISRISGRLIAKDLDRVEIMTPGGVGYELAIPLSVYEGLPKPGEEVTLDTHLVVREDQWLLFGFASVTERRVFQKLLGANGVGPALALGMLSTLTAERVVRGAWGSHSIQLRNNGPVAVGDVVVRLSAGVRESLVWIGGLDCATESANPFRALCVLEGPLGTGEVRNITFMTGTGGRLTPPQYDVTVEVEADVHDPDTGNNAARARIYTVRGD